MNITGWGYLPKAEHKPSVTRQHRTGKSRPYRRDFELSNGERVTAPMLARDARNVHGIKTNTIRSRLERGILDLGLALGPNPGRGRPLKPKP